MPASGASSAPGEHPRGREPVEATTTPQREPVGAGSAPDRSRSAAPYRPARDLRGEGARLLQRPEPAGY